MKKVFHFVCCCAVLVLGAAQFSFVQYNSQPFVEGELLVKYKSGTRSERAQSMNASAGAIVLEDFSELGWQRVKLPADTAVKQAAAFYKQSAEVESVQPNYYYHLLNTANDTRFSELYGMQKISAPAAWDLSTGSQATGRRQYRYRRRLQSRRLNH